MKTKFLLERIMNGQGKSIDLIALKMLADIEPQLIFNGLSIGIPEGIVSDYQFEMLKVDQATRSFLRCVHHLKKDPKYYVLKPDLAKAFSETKLEVDPKYLPDYFCGAFELHGITDVDGDSIENAIMTFQRLPDRYFIDISMLIKSKDNNIHNLGFLSFALEGDDKAVDIKGLIESLTYTKMVSDGNEIKQIVEQAVYPDYLTIFINTVLYATYTEVAPRQNPFMGSRKAVETQRKIYSEVAFRILGDGFSLPKTYSIDSTEVRGHFRWQRHGEGFSLLKYIYIEPHIRNYK